MARHGAVVMGPLGADDKCNNASTSWGKPKGQVDGLGSRPAALIDRCPGTALFQVNIISEQKVGPAWQLISIGILIVLGGVDSLPEGSR